MEQKQVIAYQLELFDINGEGVVYPFPTREAVCGAQGTKDLQVKTAGKQERALVCNTKHSTIYRNRRVRKYARWCERAGE